MIQRIQSVYLLLSALAMSAGMFLFPLMIVDGEVMMLTEKSYMVILAGVCAGISLASIFSYKNRRAQVAINRLNTILSFVIFGLLITFYISAEEGVEVKGSVGMVMPLINVILLVLANRGIQKDELLVRSADRLR